MAKRLAAIALFILVACAAVGPIRSYDFFWHLATGRWIVDHRAIPTYDPFTLAAAHVPWINGEWLWEAGAYAVPIGAVSWINAIFVGAMFAIAFWFASRDIGWPLALIAACFAFAGASDRLGIRPAEAAAFRFSSRLLASWAHRIDSEFVRRLRRRFLSSAHLYYCNRRCHRRVLRWPTRS